MVNAHRRSTTCCTPQTRPCYVPSAPVAIGSNRASSQTANAPPLCRRAPQPSTIPHHPHEGHKPAAQTKGEREQPARPWFAPRARGLVSRHTAFNTKHVLLPPKPNEFDTATRTLRG